MSTRIGKPWAYALIGAIIVSTAVVLTPNVGQAQSSSSEISFRARGYANDNSELVELEINGQVVETFGMRDGFEVYAYTVTASTTLTSLKLNYINDATFGRRHPNNRNVRVDYIEVDGVRIQSSDDDTRVKGVRRGDGDRCRAVITGHESERLDCNGYFDYGDAVGLQLAAPAEPPAPPAPPAPPEPPAQTGDFYVSANGSDANSGTSPSDAFATIATAIYRASPNDTILIAGGTYREGEILVYKPVTLQGYGAEDVWLKGSQDISSGWTRSGDNWVYDGWTVDFCRAPAGNCSTFPIDYELNPYSFHADMLFIDGTPLVEVGSIAELSSNAYDRPGYVGRFFVDQNANRIYSNVDPRGHLVESATATNGLRIPASGSGTTIDGINVTHVASSAHWSTGTNAAIYVRGDNVSIRNSEIVWNASYGVFINPSTTSAEVNGQGYALENNNISHNGMNGAVIRDVHESSFVGNVFHDNNIERWNVDSAGSSQTDGTTPSATVAAMKVSGHSTALVFDRNTFDGNYSHGWWCDVGCSDVVFTNNIVSSNYRTAVFYEISANAIIANNIISGNGKGGLWLAESNDLAVYHNVIEDNHLFNVWFYEGRRHDASSLDYNNSATDMARFASDGVTFGLGGIDFGNNIVSNNNANGTYDVGNNGGQAVWWSDVYRADNKGEVGTGSDQDTEGFNAKFTYFDCNPTFRSDPSTPRTLIEWYGEDEIDLPPPGKYDNNFAEFNAAEGNSFQSNAPLAQGEATNPFYTLNRVTWEFQHVNSSSVSGCRTTPVEVTQALGVAPGLNTAGLIDVN